MPVSTVASTLKMIMDSDATAYPWSSARKPPTAPRDRPGDAVTAPVRRRIGLAQIPIPARRRMQMEFRYLGNSGLKISEVSYGNWVTHGSQVEADAAKVCVNAALDAGITTFDTADVYANTAAEQILGDALAGQRRESLEIFTKVYFPTGPKGPNDTGLSRKHIMESINGSLKRLQTDYVDLYQCHRYDYETPLEETMQAFADIVRQGKALYIGVSEWTSQQLRSGHALAKQLGFQLISNQPQYSMLYRVIEDEVVPTSKELGISQVVFSPIAQGVLTGKYKPGQPPPEGSRATDPHGGSNFIQRLLKDDLLERIQQLVPIAADEGLSMAQLAVAWVLTNDNVATAITGGSKPEQVTDNAAAAGKKLSPETLAKIDEVLGDAVERDSGRTADTSPKSRLT
jgi:aryl-alcohol dehydrogenase-like predicted oxidoreductase